MKPQQRTLVQIAAEIRKRAESTADIIAIGGLLREAKKQLPKDQSWLEWLAKEFDFAARTAENYMRAHGLASTFAMVANVAETRLTPTALYWLASADLGKKEIEKILRKAKTQRITGADLERSAYLKKRDEEAAIRYGDSKEIEDILDGPPPELPPQEPAPSQPLPASDADDLLDDFNRAVDILKHASSKPTARFAQMHCSPDDLRAIAAFLTYLANDRMKAAA
jgi:hypothetical protein